MRPLRLIVSLAAITFWQGCAPELTLEQETRLRGMGLDAQTALPPSPTNAKADSVEAAELGRLIFFDEDMSRDGRVACASCHVQTEGWSDDRAVSEGVEGIRGLRHSMPAHTIAFQDFYFWDGRADSAWSQALQAIESAAEMDFARTQVAHFVARNHREPYEAIFGPLPDLGGIPERAGPGDLDWEALSDEERESVERIFTNVGKLLEAYQRRLVCSDTGFDQWARGEREMTENERIGAAVFVEDRCIDCHGGVAFSDGGFHNLGIQSRGEGRDTGRAQGLGALLDDPFNGVGDYSDDTGFGERKLVRAMEESGTLGAYRTPTLRGVTQRRFFGHAGRSRTVRDFLDDAYDGGGRGRGRHGGEGVGRRDPILQQTDVGIWEDELVAFLRMLECPPVPERWQAPKP